MLLRQSVSSAAQQLLCACITAVVHAVVNCYAPTIIQTYDTPSLFRITGMYHHLTFPDAQKSTEY